MQLVPPQVPDVQLTECESVFFVGIKGVGMTALALLLQDAGVVVSGADVVENFVTDTTLANRDIVVVPFELASIPDVAQAVIFSAAHQGANHLLVVEAKRRGIPIFSLAQALGQLSAQKETIAVCGVGGKSTTSALLAWVLDQAGMAPAFSVGVGNIPNFGTSARWPEEARHFVTEADEYVADVISERVPKLLYLHPHHAICTALSFDHPDVYASFDDTKEVFARFWEQLPDTGTLVYNGDQHDLRELVASLDLPAATISVGESEENDVYLHNYRVSQGQAEFELLWSNGHSLSLTSMVPGKHNAINAAYAAAMAHELGVRDDAIVEAVASFRSVQRRFEFRGRTESGTLCYDDYAHHPREIEAVGEALRLWFPHKQRHIIFQSHTFSRTRALFDAFVDALESTQAKVLLYPIFPSAREANDPEMRAELLVEALRKRGADVGFIPDQVSLLEYVQSLGDEDVCMTLGAGDLYTVYDRVHFVSAADRLS